jgi:hypothetical protein
VTPLEREVEFAAIVVLCAREARRIDRELDAIRREAVKLAKRSTELREGMTRLLAMSREAAGHASRLQREREYTPPPAPVRCLCCGADEVEGDACWRCEQAVRKAG